MTQINPTNNTQNQASTTTDTPLECLINLHGKMIHYKGVKEVRCNHFYVVVYLYKNYFVKDEEKLRELNTSNDPYIHHYKGATIVAVRSMK